MTLAQGLPGPDINAAVGAAPFAAATVILTKQEHIELVMDVAYWRTQFDRRVARDARRERNYRLHNSARPHSSLDKQTPEEFYFATLPTIKQAA